MGLEQDKELYRLIMEDMEIIDIPRLEITSIGRSFPERIVRNEEFLNKPFYGYDKKGNRVGEETYLTEKQIIDLSGGIQERRYAGKDDKPSTMAFPAAQEAIKKAAEKLNVEPKEAFGSLRGLFFATVSEEENYAAAATKLQKKLGEFYGVRKRFEAPDIGYACAGALESMIIANRTNKTKPGNYLAVASEDVSGMVIPDDRNLFLFGAGAGAVFLSPTKSVRGIEAHYSASNPYGGNDECVLRGPKEKGRPLLMPPGKEGGQKVLDTATDEMSMTAIAIRDALGWEYVDFYAPHQANGRIVGNNQMPLLEENDKKILIGRIEKKLRRRLDMEREIKTGETPRILSNIAQWGNISGVTNINLLHEAMYGTTIPRLDGITEEPIITEGTRGIAMSIGSGLAIAGVGIQF